jgi:hypothetical protein
MAVVLPRRIAGVVVSLLLGSLLAVSALIAGAGTANAADGYRYWNYFHLKNGAWAFATQGVGAYTPHDGAVEGLRFGTSTAAQGITPRANLSKVTFAAVCPDPAPAGQKRVALVIDYGTTADADGANVPAPAARCAVVPADATTLQALGKVADVRAEKAMLCGIDGYPTQGCGVPVKNATVPKHEQTVAFSVPGSDKQGTGNAATSSGGSNLTGPLVGAGVVVVLLGGGALALNRRRQAA